MQEKENARAEKKDVTPETSFLGFDAYKKVLAMNDVDIVMLTTPPGFRPPMVRAALEAGKHIFMEKPGAVDPVGIRSLLASAELADKKRLSIVVGTQQRWQPQYLELMKRIHDGKLGDHIVEQHLHNMDVINWAVGSPPVSCLGMGGRQARTGPEFGNIYDHFTVEYEYPNGIRVMSMCSQIEGSTPRVGERVVCTKGSTYTTRAEGYIDDTNGRRIFKYNDPIHSGEVAQYANLIKSIRRGEPINESKRLAESTMTVIMGRMSAYTGRAMKWDWAMKASKLDLSPQKCELGELPVRPVAVPGQTRLI